MSDFSDSAWQEAGLQILTAHNRGGHENDIRAAIQSFITTTGLAKQHDIRLEAGQPLVVVAV